MSELYYGLDSDEHLSHEHPEEVLQECVDVTAEPGEKLEAVLDRMHWPVVVLEYKRADVSKDVDRLVRNALEDILLSLDEEYGDPEGEPTKLSPEVLAVGAALAAIIKHQYSPWAMVPTGNRKIYLREDAGKIVG